MTYTEELTYCDGSVYVIFTNTACTIPLSVLTAAPYSLTMGMSVKLRVVAYNAYGDSVASPIGYGALIVYVPFAPTDL